MVGENRMLTRREVLIELKRVGVTELYLLKRYCRSFEDYIKVNYDFQIVKKGQREPQGSIRMQSLAE